MTAMQNEVSSLSSDTSSDTLPSGTQASALPSGTPSGTQVSALPSGTQASALRSGHVQLQPVYAAVINGVEIMEKAWQEKPFDLEQKDQRFDYTFLAHAIYDGRDAAVDWLLEKKANVETRFGIFHYTALLQACARKNRYAVKVLLDRAAVVDSVDNEVRLIRA
jgi:hypothetical protein